MEDTPACAKGNSYLNNATCEVCGKKIVIGKVKPADEKDKVQIFDKTIQFTCMLFLKPVELLFMYPHMMHNITLFVI